MCVSQGLGSFTKPRREELFLCYIQVRSKLVLTREEVSNKREALLISFIPKNTNDWKQSTDLPRTLCSSYQANYLQYFYSNSSRDMPIVGYSFSILLQ